jgi:hypothetical protein
MVEHTLFLDPFVKTSSLHNSPGYGVGFERKFTRDACEMGPDASDHYRYHLYDFGGLSVVVRHEVDAYYEAGQAKSHSVAASSNPHQYVANPGLRTHNGATAVEIRGEVIDGCKTAELKSHTGRRAVDETKMAEPTSYANLEANTRRFLSGYWFSRTSWALKAYIDNSQGKCTHVQVINLAERFSDFERDHQESLRKLVSLLRMVGEEVRKRPDKRAILVIPPFWGNIELKEMKEDRNTIPDDIVQAFWSPSVTSHRRVLSNTFFGDY